MPKIVIAKMTIAVNFLSMVCFAHDPNTPQDSNSLIHRINSRCFPSVFQAWSPCESFPDMDKWEIMAKHDLVFISPSMIGLKWNHEFLGLAEGFLPESIEPALAIRKKLLELNQNLVLLAEIRYRDAAESYLPSGHKWFKRDPNGNTMLGWDEGNCLLLDFSSPEFCQQVAKQAKAAVESGIFDGIMLDWWDDDKERLELVKTVRKAIGPAALIIANANDRKTPQTAPYINGYFMECHRSESTQDWQRIADTLQWAESNLRKPTINCLELWYHNSRNDMKLMRTATCLSLTLSNGYCLFSDPNPLPKPDHLHDWYDFWDADLGRPAAKGKKDPAGYIIRDFEKGKAVYNPMGNMSIKLHFEKPLKRASNNQTAVEHTLESCDGDIFLYPE